MDFESLLRDCRGYLGLSQGDAVPLDELKEQARANGYTDSEIRAAFRSTDKLENVGEIDAPKVVLAEAADSSAPEDGSADSTPTPEVDETASSAGDWADIDFSETASETYPPELLEREQWMGRLAGTKQPFAPWGDRDHPEAAEDKDARYKWGLRENYTTGEKVALAEDDARLDGRVFIQREDDGLAFVDGDDVRCSETGDVHPAFTALLDRLGLSYADVSMSESGVHVPYKGDLPGDQGQAVFEIDTEPWGENEDAPTVEIYANKHVCVTTGEHVEGTPLEVREWDADAIEAILDEYDARKETETFDHDTDRDLGLGDHTPSASGRDETTTDPRDIAHAVDRLRPSDLRLQSSQVGSDATGWEQWDPSSYRTSSGNDSLHRPPSDPVFHDHKHNESFGVLSLLAAEQGIISKPWDRLSGSDWWDAVDVAREQGAPIPEYEGVTEQDTEQVAVLPPAVRDLSTATSGWDWRHTARESERELSIEDARERTVGAISDAYERGDRVLIEALPTMGKSYGSIKAAAETGEQITVLTGRGRKEQYGQFREWADEHGLSHYTLPSFTRDCLTANGEHGAEWKETVMGWYRRGATPREIHAFAESVLNRPLPCQEHDGQECPYTSKWRFDPGEYDVLIGHYNHAHNEKATSGRVCVFDEFPGGAYETKLTTGLQGAVSYWLQTTEGVPFDDYTDLLENRSDDQRRSDALTWFLDRGVDTDETQVFDDSKAHAAAPLAVFTILASDDLGNGFEVADLEDAGTAVRSRENDAVSILQPPSLEYASGVVALDGTPTTEMWEQSLGERLNHRPVLQDGERAEYIRSALNLNLVRTTDAVKSYSPKATEIENRVSLKEDTALLEKIAAEHGERPSLVTTNRAKQYYATEGVIELDDGQCTGGLAEDVKHYGNVLGSNEFKDKRLGAVLGSRNYGPDYVKKWGAYLGETIDPTYPSPENDFTPTDYGQAGNKIRTHMREHETLQAAMRFGRDGNGAVVYVHTDTLPEWVPVAGEARVVSTWSDGMRQVLQALEDLGGAPTSEIVDHPEVDLSRQQVFDHLETLEDKGVLDRQQDPEDGRRVLWADDGLHRVGEHGDVDLEPVELDDLSSDETAELAENTVYSLSWADTETLQTVADADGPTGGDIPLVPDGGTPPDGGGG